MLTDSATVQKATQLSAVLYFVPFCCCVETHRLVSVNRTAEFPVHTSFQTNYPCYHLDGVAVYMRWCGSLAPPSPWQTPP
jgi:hypothetical protein